MTLDDIFNALSYGELRQLYKGTGDSGLIGVNDRAQIISSISLGLTELYKRFLLKEGRITIERVPGVYTYSLTRDYAESNTASTQPHKYIKDLSNPFMDDLLKVHCLYDELGEEIAMNDIGDKQAIRTTSLNTLLIPGALESPTVEVVYHADHPALDVRLGIANPRAQFIELPKAYLDALLLYVASRVFNPMGAGGEFHEGNNYAAKFEGACALLDSKGLEIDTYGSEERFALNGWR